MSYKKLIKNFKFQFGNKKHTTALKYILKLKKLEKKKNKDKSKADKRKIEDLKEKIMFNLK